MRYEQALRRLRALFEGVPPLKACLGNDRRLPNKEEWSTFISNLKVYLQDKSFRRQYRIGSWKKMALENMLKGSGKRTIGSVSAMAAAGILAIVGGTSLAPKDAYAQEEWNRPVVADNSGGTVVASTGSVVPVTTAPAQNVDHHLDQGYAQFNQQNYDGAIASAEGALRLLPSRDQYTDANVVQATDAYMLKGASLYRQGDMNGALEFYTEAVRTDPRHITARLNRIDALNMLGQSVLARQELDPLLQYLGSVKNEERDRGHANNLRYAQRLDGQI